MNARSGEPMTGSGDGERRSVPVPEREVIGWREWVGLPDFGVETIKAKVDTGARTSSLHAFDLETFQRRGRDWVRFKIHPEQSSSKGEVGAEVPLQSMRSVRSSSGRAEMRPVVMANITLLGSTWPVELTLTRRDAMGFRMLLGRQAIRGRFTVDPGRSFLNGRRVKGSRRLKLRAPVDAAKTNSKRRPE